MPVNYTETVLTMTEPWGWWDLGLFYIKQCFVAVQIPLRS